MNAEQLRLEEAREQKMPWKKWGPYLSERQWGTVREDYSEGGNAWDYFSHDQARSRAYRWGEDGLAGISDDQQRLCFALALWNGKDPILKERLFGLTNSESNHGEDVKEYYFYLDSTPTHSYMKYLYKYPQAAFPYANLVDTSRGRSRNEFEYELLDTGVFDENRYFDVFVEYAKESPEDILIQITVHNRGPEAAELHVLPTLWFRNQWSWQAAAERPIAAADRRQPDERRQGRRSRAGRALSLLRRRRAAAVHRERNQHAAHLRRAQPHALRQGRHQQLRRPRPDGRGQPEQKGTKAAAHYRVTVAARRMPGRFGCGCRDRAGRFARQRQATTPFGSTSTTCCERAARRPTSSTRRSFPPSLNADQANVMRQALAGMLWSKQFYHYDVDKWLEERGSDPFKANRKQAPRNDHWHHMYNGDVISMPDKWEYPWYAAWDLAFHVLALTLVDPDFGKQQLKLMLRERYMHPNGQIPAYEWNFGDVNPPVHAWSTIFTYRLEKAQNGRRRQGLAQEQLPEAAAQLHLVGQPQGPLGTERLRGRLPGPGQHRRVRPQRAAADRRLPGAGRRHRLDGPVLPEHARDRRRTGDDRSGLRGHGAQVRRALPVDRLVDGARGRRHRHVGRGGRLLLRRAAPAQRPGPAAQGPVDGRACCRCARPRSSTASCWRSTPSSASACSGSSKRGPNCAPRSTTRASRASPAAGSPRSSTKPSSAACWRRCSTRTSSSASSASARCRATTPTIRTSFNAGGQEYRVAYLPAESDTGMFGGNSNWRGPIWMPVNAPDHPRPAAVLHLLRRRLHRRMPDRLGPA